MVFYFANPRRGTSRAQGGDGRHDRQRTAPSMFVYYVLAPVSVIFSLFLAYLPVVAHLVNDYLGGKTTVSRHATDGPPEPLKLSDRIPVLLPGVMICFKARPSGDAMDILDRWGLEPERVANVKKEVFLLRNPTVEDYEEILSFSGLDTSFRPPTDYITPAAIPALMEIINGISVIARCQGLQHFEVIRQDLEISDKDVVRGTRAGHSASDGQDADMEPGEVGELSPDLVRLGGGDPVFTLSGTSDLPSDITPWGSVEHFLTLGNPGGLMCPFEKNFAAPDPHAVKELISSYPWLFTTTSAGSTDLDDIMSYWITEISQTMCGMVLSHMIVSLKLAAMAGRSTYFIQIPDRHYDGSIIVGQGFSVGGPGIETVVSGPPTQLEFELKEYGFHTETLRKILLECGLQTVDPNSVKSMRQLREMVFAGTGAPTGTTQNKVLKWLPGLSFAEKPLGVNTTSIERVMRLLANPTMVIPLDLFLPTECFFTPEVNRTQLIICAWGTNPPTFNYSGKPLLATVTKGVGAGNLEAYSATPPRTLQMKRVAMANAVAGWNTMLDKGYIWGEYNSRTSQSRQFQGKDKVDLWKLFNEILSGTVRKPQGEIVMHDDTAPRGIKRVQTDSSAEERVVKRGRLFKK